MSERESDANAIDPPENTGGGGKAEAEAPADDAAAIDPPENTGGGN
jgi:hypothetical protein